MACNNFVFEKYHFSFDVLMQTSPNTAYHDWVTLQVTHILDLTYCFIIL